MGNVSLVVQYQSNISEGLAASLLQEAPFKSWILDCGVALYIVCESSIAGLEATRSQQSVQFITANGSLECSEQVALRVPGFKEPFHAHILPSTPELLSMGVMHATWIRFHLETIV